MTRAWHRVVGVTHSNRLDRTPRSIGSLRLRRPNRPRLRIAKIRTESQGNRRAADSRKRIIGLMRRTDRWITRQNRAQRTVSRARTPSDQTAGSDPAAAGAAPVAPAVHGGRRRAKTVKHRKTDWMRRLRTFERR